MGIVLKRRDNAPIVKHVFGNVIEKIMIDKDLHKSVEWLQQTLQDIRSGNYPMSKFIITKSLRGYYKNPQGIAHKVLADRMKERDPGNFPKAGDRMPYAYVKVDDSPIKTGKFTKIKQRIQSDETYKNGKPKFKTITINGIEKTKKRNILQGDRIEDPSYIHKHSLDLDYEFYITNQIMNPVKQVLDLEMDAALTEKLFSK
jgi:DNA polymerase elongation subunit (family B)